MLVKVKGGFCYRFRYAGRGVVGWWVVGGGGGGWGVVMGGWGGGGGGGVSL